MVGRTVRGVVLAFAVCVPLAHGTVINGDFETGAFPPWTITNTASGRTIFQDVTTFDIDGPAPKPASLAARFMAGQTQPQTGYQGIVIHQSVTLDAETTYTLRTNWACQALISAPGSAGRFELLVDGTPIAEAIAPNLTQGQRTYGMLEATFSTAGATTHTIGVRITRNVSYGYEVYQFVDNITVSLACDPDVNCDGSADGFDVETMERAVGGDLADFCPNDADFNGDGSVDGFDVEGVERAVGGGACS